MDGFLANVKYLTLILILKTNYVFSVTCKYYPNYPSSNASLAVRYCNYCCSIKYPITASQACCYRTYSRYNSEYWWISLIVIIPFVIIFFIAACCAYLKKSKKKLCGLSDISCCSVRTCGLCSNCCPKSQRIENFNSQSTYPINPTLNLPINANNIQNEKPPTYEEFTKQNPIILIENTDGANPLPVLPAPVLKPTQ